MIAIVAPPAWSSSSRARIAAPLAHRIVFCEFLAFGHCLLREPDLLGGYADALRLLPAARRRRALIAPRRAGGRRVPFGIRPPR
ncbi:MAG TPA: hypothetical protein VIJ51_06860 [Solirubrobacteraceae bacterium]